MTVKTLLKRAFSKAVEAAQFKDFAAYLPEPPKGRLLVIGAGKAAAQMAQRVEAHYPHASVSGLVITRYGHAAPTQAIEVREASHPLPDRAGQLATEAMLSLLKDVKEEDLVLCLISGGGSALLTAPLGIDLKQTIALTEALLASGASIIEMNTVRKHLSRVKGGRLAAAAYPARLLSLIVSDVVGDDPASIASGPTVPDPSTFAQALAVLERYAIAVPEAREVFKKGIAGALAETPKPGDEVFAKAEYQVVASNQQSLEAAAQVFRDAAWPTYILSSYLTGEAKEAAKVLAAIVKQIVEHGQPFKRPCVLLSGGETTVSMQTAGKGGRNSEFALSLACELAGYKAFVLAADTDGIDGSEDNAGVLYGPDLLNTLDLQQAQAYLDRHDSYSFFAGYKALFTIGPTGTNVNDLRIIVVP